MAYLKDKSSIENLKLFFLDSKVQKALEVNDFTTLFDLYNKFKVGRCNWGDLIRLLDICDIDWIHNTSYIPPYCYDDGLNKGKSLTIPKNIKLIKGNFLYPLYPAIEVYYEGTKEEFKRIEGKDYIINYCKENKVICSDGDFKWFEL